MRTQEIGPSRKLFSYSSVLICAVGLHALASRKEWAKPETGAAAKPFPAPEEARMDHFKSDNPNKTAPQDAQRINMGQKHEVRYWTERFGVSKDKLQQAVDRAGPMVKDVERELSAAKTSA